MGARSRLAWLTVSCVVVVLGVCGSVSATLVHSFVGSFGFGSLSNPQSVAVDDSSGDVYVLNVGSESISRFDAAGAPAPFSALSSSTIDGVGGADAIPEGGFSFDSNSAAQVAVDNSSGVTRGYVYVANSFGGGGVVDVFDPTGTFVGELNGALASPETGGEACGVAVSASGAVYASYYGSHVDEYTPVDGTPGKDVFVGQLEKLNANCNVAADSTGDVYVSTWDKGPLTRYEPSQLNLESPAGTVIDNKSLAVTVDQANGHVLVDEGDQIAEFDASGALVGQSGFETLSGSSYGVALNGTTGDLYASDASSGNVERFGAAQGVLLVPAVTTQAAQDLAPTHATLRGVVTPKHTQTSYYFEYGQSTAYGSSVPVNRDGDAGIVGSVGAIKRLDGLQPGTTYHYRLVASDHDGATNGEDQVFTTTVALSPSIVRAGIPGSGFLPDDRGWELVSPAQKNGADVMADSARVHIASDGGAAVFASLGGFADVQGTGVANEYMAVRDGQAGTSGWVTHAITPKQQPLTFGGAIQSMDPLYEGDFSADLSKGVFRAWSPLTEEPDVATVENDYLRTDLRTPGTGTYQLLSSCPACGSTPLISMTKTQEMPRVAGASADFDHVIFESTYNLTSDAPAQPNSCFGPCPRLYEWDHGTLRLAGILPDGSAAASSAAGRSASQVQYTTNTISSDGSHVFFTDDSTTQGDATGELYVRIDHSRTLQINESERSPAEPSQPAEFWTASSDGSRAFFTTGERLTTDDTNGTSDLYMWDEHSSPHLTRISVSETSEAPDVSGAIGASADGHWVYFVAFRQLVAGEPKIGGNAIFLWHDGHTSYVGELADTGDVHGTDLPTGSYGLGALEARVSPDGRSLLFTSHSGNGLTGYAQTCAVALFGCSEVYLYRAGAKLLECVSCDPGGVLPVGQASVNVRSRTSGSGTTSHLSYALSDDGTRVFFSTPDALVPEDSNGKYDAYEYDAVSGTVHLLSSGRDPHDSYFVGASPEGSDAFILTAQQLVGWDHDQSYDLYDARVEGGLPEPPSAPSECSGEDCRAAGAASAATVPPVAPADAFSRTRNVKPPAGKVVVKSSHCKRGLIRRKVRGRSRCVKAKVKARARQHRAGKAGRGRGGRLASNRGVSR